MDCDEARRLLEPYLDGELDRTEARALEAHIDGCSECQAVLAQLGRLRHVLRTEAPRYAAPAALRERIRTSNLRERDRAARRRIMPAWWRLAAACLAAFVAGSVLMWSWHSGVDRRDQLVS
ncbi:MAG TPA: zf-HC2 domain-containing protein, partial [Rhodanobacteraceae bacterium]